MTPQAYYEEHEADWFDCVESSLHTAATHTGGRLKVLGGVPPPLSDVATLRTAMGKTMRKEHFPDEARVQALLDNARAFADSEDTAGRGWGWGEVMQLSEGVALTMLASEARRHSGGSTSLPLGKLRGYSNLLHHAHVVQISTDEQKKDRLVPSGEEGTTVNGNGNGSMLYLVPPICDDAVAAGSDSRRFQTLQLSIVGLCVLLDILQKVGSSRVSR
jgi:hypothetical protein